jgi:hypothetical protein
VVVVTASLAHGQRDRTYPTCHCVGRFERPAAPEGTPAAAWRYVFGALMTCGGLALLAAQGVGGYGQFGLNVWGLALAFAGICLIAGRPTSTAA